MADTPSGPVSASPARGRGRGKSRGGHGKYLRAQGRGRRGGGRQAVFNERLLLEGEVAEDIDPESEEAKELRTRYAKRQLTSNADRYVEPEPELGSDGEEISEPEVDLTAFLDRQRTSPDLSSVPPSQPPDDDDVDHSLTHATPKSMSLSATQNRKGRIQQIEWDNQLEEMSREKTAAEATRELKSRFKAQTERLKTKPLIASHDRKSKRAVVAPELPDMGPSKSQKEEMQDFLDDLLG